MRFKWVVCLMVLALLATGVAGEAIAGFAVQDKSKWELYGPHADEIIMPIIKEQEAQLIAMERGDIHVLGGLTRPAAIDRLKTNPNIDITMNYGFHMFYLCFNMRRPPMGDLAIRRAVAHVTNRDQIIRSLFQGYMLPLATFLPQSSPFYHKKIVPYAYDVEQAKKVLDDAGYRLEPGAKVRTDPKTGKPIREMLLMTPTYEVAPTSAEIGKILAEACQSVGIPVKAEPTDFNTMLAKIDKQDFDLYVLAWSLDRFPTSLHRFFHSVNDVEAGYNRPGIRDPELDRVLDELNFAPDRATAMRAALKAQEMLNVLVPYVVLYSRPYMDAFRKDIVTGYVPMHGWGAATSFNKWTPLSLRRVDQKGGTIRWCLTEEPKDLNPCTASSAYEWEVLRKIGAETMIWADPETVADTPGVAKSWKVETWEPEPGKYGTKVTYYLRDNLKWHDGMPVTSEDFKFSLEFLKDNKVPRFLSSVKDIVKVETPFKHTVVVYFSNVSYWHVYDGDVEAVLPKHIWKDVKDYKTFKPWLEPHPTVKGLTKLIGFGPYVFKEYRPGEYVRLVKFQDYWRSNPYVK